MCDTYFFTLTISIHALREESDARLEYLDYWFSEFQSTLSVRRATDKNEQAKKLLQISIHALREESD